MIRVGHRVGLPQVYGSRQQARPHPLMAPDERYARARTGHDHPARTLDPQRRTAEQQATTMAGAR
jgi:hypothetical protein